MTGVRDVSMIASRTLASPTRAARRYAVVVRAPVPDRGRHPRRAASAVDVPRPSRSRIPAMPHMAQPARRATVRSRPSSSGTSSAARRGARASACCRRRCRRRPGRPCLEDAAHAEDAAPTSSASSRIVTASSPATLSTRLSPSSGALRSRAHDVVDVDRVHPRSAAFVERDRLVPRPHSIRRGIMRFRWPGPYGATKRRIDGAEAGCRTRCTRRSPATFVAE